MLLNYELEVIENIDIFIVLYILYWIVFGREWNFDLNIL